MCGMSPDSNNVLQHACSNSGFRQYPVSCTSTYKSLGKGHYILHRKKKVVISVTDTDLVGARNKAKIKLYIPFLGVASTFPSPPRHRPTIRKARRARRAW